MIQKFDSQLLITATCMFYNTFNPHLLPWFNKAMFTINFSNYFESCFHYQNLYLKSQLLITAVYFFISYRLLIITYFLNVCFVISIFCFFFFFYFESIFIFKYILLLILFLFRLFNCPFLKSRSNRMEC